jgi:hypothetical protein
MQLMHHKFNGIKILPAIKASGQIVVSIDGGVYGAANRAGKGKLAIVVAGGN